MFVFDAKQKNNGGIMVHYYATPSTTTMYVYVHIIWHTKFWQF